MKFAAPLAIGLGLVASVQGAPLEPREEPFKCKDGYTVTTYTNTGIITCTKIQGSAISVGYSAQTVVFVGLVSGLTGLITACLPLGKFFYKSGTGYFRARPGASPTWEQAYPRRSLGDQEGEDLDLQDYLHTAWYSAHQQLQDEHYDPASIPATHTTDNSTIFHFVHQDFNHTHGFHVVPHNETHDTYHAYYDVAAIKSVVAEGENDLVKRANSFTGYRVTMNNFAEKGRYGATPLSQNDGKLVATVIASKYISSVANQNPGKSELCAFVGDGTSNNKHPAIAEITISSQYGGIGGAYPASTCPSGWTSSMDDPYDEL